MNRFEYFVVDKKGATHTGTLSTKTNRRSKLEKIISNYTKVKKEEALTFSIFDTKSNINIV